MEPTNKPPVDPSAKKRAKPELAVDFLPDADEMERRPLPPFARITVKVLAAALASFLIWASFSQIDEIVVAHGKLVNTQPNLVVQPLETSVIQHIDVKVGQIVHKGERLATLDPTFATADDAQLRSRLQSLDTQSQGLTAELSGTRSQAKGGNDADTKLQTALSAERQANYAAQQTKMNDSIARERAVLETNRHDQQLLTERVKSLREIEAMQTKLLAQDFGSRLKVLEAQDRRQEVERELQLTKSREAELTSELSAMEAEKAAFDKGWRQKTMEDLLSTSRERDGLHEQLQKADMRKRLINLVAPADAVVLEIAKLSQGSIVREAEPFFTLVPLNADLEAEVQIDATDIGYIKPNQPVMIKVDAFPFQRHGGLKGNVTTISEDAFRREAAAQGQSGTFYQATASFGKAHLKNLAPQTRMLPGMTLSAEIAVGKRTVLSYFLWPLTKAFNESLREP